jgi:hypothetical protein
VEERSEGGEAATASTRPTLLSRTGDLAPTGDQIDLGSVLLETKTCNEPHEAGGAMEHLPW